ncbi:MAG: hypothetical protein AAFZ63_01945 [Bacteroidota bacterium]
MAQICWATGRFFSPVRVKCMRQNVATSAFLNHFKDEAAIAFRPSTRNWLTLIFDKNEQAKQKDFEELSLTVKY